MQGSGQIAERRELEKAAPSPGAFTRWASRVWEKTKASGLLTRHDAAATASGGTLGAVVGSSVGIAAAGTAVSGALPVAVFGAAVGYGANKLREFSTHKQQADALREELEQSLAQRDRAIAIARDVPRLESALKDAQARLQLAEAELQRARSMMVQVKAENQRLRAELVIHPIKRWWRQLWRKQPAA